ncbi:MAG: acyltransferase [Muribaculaceae bacterium]|nr:acyltransferase [Muribaculaceae bacterium]
MHNLCHLIGGITRENEFAFNYSNVNKILGIDELSIKSLYDILSFFGWYGVPVFMFLSGYGLVKKYEQNTLSASTFSIPKFLMANYKKLFLLMLPGTILYLLYRLWLTWHFATNPLDLIGLSVATQTLLSNLTYPSPQPEPGVYWYFGLTLQLYVVYALLFRKRADIILLIAAILCIVPQYLVAHTEWLRHNCISWIPVFAVGIWYSRHHTSNKWVYGVLLMVAIISFIPSTFNAYSWQWSVIAAVGVILALATLSNKIPVWRNIWIWIGKMSPYIFAAHPLLRAVFLQYSNRFTLTTMLISYAVLIPVVAIIYKWLWQQMQHIFIKLRLEKTPSKA